MFAPTSSDLHSDHARAFPAPKCVEFLPARQCAPLTILIADALDEQVMRLFCRENDLGLPLIKNHSADTILPYSFFISCHKSTPFLSSTNCQTFPVTVSTKKVFFAKIVLMNI